MESAGIYFVFDNDAGRRAYRWHCIACERAPLQSDSSKPGPPFCRWRREGRSQSGGHERALQAASLQEMHLNTINSKTPASAHQLIQCDALAANQALHAAADERRLRLACSAAVLPGHHRARAGRLARHWNRRLAQRLPGHVGSSGQEGRSGRLPCKPDFGAAQCSDGAGIHQALQLQGDGMALSCLASLRPVRSLSACQSVYHRCTTCAPSRQAAVLHANCRHTVGKEPLITWLSSRASTSAAGRAAGSMTSKLIKASPAALVLLAPSSASKVASVGSRKAVFGGGLLNSSSGEGQGERDGWSSVGHRRPATGRHRCGAGEQSQAGTPCRRAAHARWCSSPTGKSELSSSRASFGSTRRVQELRYPRRRPAKMVHAGWANGDVQQHGTRRRWAAAAGFGTTVNAFGQISLNNQDHSALRVPLTLLQIASSAAAPTSSPARMSTLCSRSACMID